jgi:hypothetical protein
MTGAPPARRSPQTHPRPEPRHGAQMAQPLGVEQREAPLKASAARRCASAQPRTTPAGRLTAWCALGVTETQRGRCASRRGRGPGPRQAGEA